MNRGIVIFKNLVGAAILVGLIFGTYPALKTASSRPSTRCGTTSPLSRSPFAAACPK